MLGLCLGLMAFNQAGFNNQGCGIHHGTLTKLQLLHDSAWQFFIRFSSKHKIVGKFALFACGRSSQQYCWQERPSFFLIREVFVIDAGTYQGARCLRIFSKLFVQLSQMLVVGAELAFQGWIAVAFGRKCCRHEVKALMWTSVKGK